MEGVPLRQYIKENYEKFVGLRPVKSIQVYNENMLLVIVGPDDFFYRKGSIEKPYMKLGSLQRYHIPRSLCRRARVLVNKDGNIVSRGKMNYANQ